MWKQQDFSAEHIDEQVEQLLEEGESQQGNQVDRRFGRDMQRFSHEQAQRDAVSLQRVWDRLTAAHPELAASEPNNEPLEQFRPGMLGKTVQISSRRNWQRTIGLLSAVAVVVVLIGSALAVFTIFPHRGSGVGRGGQTISAPAASVAQGVYVFSDKVLYRLDANSHNVIWSVSIDAFENRLVGRPAVSGDLVYVSASEIKRIASDNYAVPYLFAFNVKNGKQVWKTQLATPVLQKQNTGAANVYNSGLAAQPVVAGDSIYVNVEPSVVYALDAKTGAIRWTFDTYRASSYCVTKNDPQRCLLTGMDTLVVQGNTAYVALYDTVFALDVQKGKQLWQANILESQGIEQRLVVSNGTLYASSRMPSQPGGPLSRDSYLWAFDAKSGKLSWKVLTQTAFLTAPAVYQDRVYVAGYTGVLYAINCKDGKIVWQVNTSGTLIDAPLVTATGLFQSVGVTSTSGQGKYLGLNPATGAVLWQKLATQVSLLVASQGILYGSEGLAVAAWSANDGRLLWEENLPGTLTGPVGITVVP